MLRPSQTGQKDVMRCAAQESLKVTWIVESSCIEMNTVSSPASLSTYVHSHMVNKTKNYNLVNGSANKIKFK